MTTICLYGGFHCIKTYARISITRHGRLLSTSALGTLYEEHCQRSLQDLFPGRLELQKIGGRGDRGVDLTGWWHVPPRPDTRQDDDLPLQRVRVLVQCKSSLSPTKKLGPVILREMEGVIGRYRSRLRASSPNMTQDSYENDEISTPLLGIICSSSGFSKQTNTQVNGLDGVNFLLIHLALPDLQEGQQPISSSYPTTILSSPSLQDRQRRGNNRLEGYFDLQWERSITQPITTKEQDHEDEEQTDHALRPLLTWRSYSQ